MDVNSRPRFPPISLLFLFCLGACAPGEKRTGEAGAVSNGEVTWEQAIASISDSTRCPAYGGGQVTIQEGLRPLGRDPSSGLWEFLVVGTGEAPERGPTGEFVVAADTGIVLVLLPGGTFRMGAEVRGEDADDHADPAALADEGPVHGVHLEPFFLAKFELTRGQWGRIGGAGGDEEGLGNVPVFDITWDEGRAALRAFGMDLPTEAQWEYAARAGTATPWSSGADRKSLRGAANLADSFLRANGGPPGWTYEEWLDDGHAACAPVGSFRANALGLYDTGGNVSEWTLDAYASYEGRVRAGDGLREGGDMQHRVARGGSHRHSAASARSAAREPMAPDDRAPHLGLRAARKLDR